MECPDVIPQWPILTLPMFTMAGVLCAFILRDRYAHEGPLAVGLRFLKIGVIVGIVSSLTRILIHCSW